MNKSLLGASLFALALAAPAVHAHEAGDILIRAGAITVNPKADSSTVKLIRAHWPAPTWAARRP